MKKSYKITSNVPLKIGGRLFCGTVKNITTVKKDIAVVVPQNTGYFEPFLVPTDITFNSFGDLIKSSNVVSKEIKSIKRPKKRKAGQNLKQENVIDTVFKQGFLYGNALKVAQSEASRTNNKRKKNRK